MLKLIFFIIFFINYNIFLNSKEINFLNHKENSSEINSILNEIDLNNIKNNLQKIVGIRNFVTGKKHLEETKNFILDNFTKNNLIIKNYNFDFLSYKGLNITGTIKGLKSNNKTYILCSHYDSQINTPGADDNGIAVAVMIELARILSKYKFNNNIKFIGFDLEEIGKYGSIQYVNNCIEKNENISFVINLEMIGYYSNEKFSQKLPAGFNILFPEHYKKMKIENFRGNFIAIVGNNYSIDYIKKIEEIFKYYSPDLSFYSISIYKNGEIAPSLRRSDHASFWDAGFKAIMLTDTANFRNKYYHTKDDTIDKINFDFVFKNCKAILASLLIFGEIIL